MARICFAKYVLMVQQATVKNLPPRQGRAPLLQQHILDVTGVCGTLPATAERHLQPPN